MADAQSTVEYREIPGFPNYRAGTDGSIQWKSPRGEWTLKRIFPDHAGYMKVQMSGGEGLKARFVHRLVLLAFVGPPPEGHECCHGNHDRADNRIENLRWGTRQENIGDQVKRGTHTRKVGEENGRAKLTEQDIVTIRSLHHRLTMAAMSQMFGVSNYAIQDVIYRRKWCHVAAQEQAAVEQHLTTHVRGERCAASRLTETAVRDIFSCLAAGWSRRSLAKKFGVSKSAIDRLANGKSWKHVSRPQGGEK